MLTDPKDIELLSGALEPGIRLPSRSSHGPAEIVRDFMCSRRFDGQHVLELGPGHYEFCDYVKARGGSASVVELDPCVAELGRRRGYGVHRLDLRDLPKLLPDMPFDGLFCKGSNNPFWFYADTAALENYTDTLNRLVRPGGWVWVAACPWFSGAMSGDQFASWLEVERKIYLSRGFSAWRVPSKHVGGYYAISVPCDGLYVYTKGLPKHRWTTWSSLGLMSNSLRRLAAKICRAGR